MPNIEIRGFPFCLPVGTFCSGSLGAVPGGVIDARIKIERAMKKLGLGEDAITDIVPSIANSCNGAGKSMPYLRVCDTDPERMGRIVQALKEENIGMDVETLLLSGFIEAKDMKA